MPRRPRLFVPGAIYHVHCRVARGELVFDEHHQAIEFIEIVRKVRDLDGLTIFAWCLKGSHYHIVLKTGEIALWRTMARLQTANKSGSVYVVPFPFRSGTARPRARA